MNLCRFTYTIRYPFHSIYIWRTLQKSYKLSIFTIIICMVLCVLRHHINTASEWKVASMHPIFIFFVLYIFILVDGKSLPPHIFITEKKRFIESHEEWRMILLSFGHYCKELWMLVYRHRFIYVYTYKVFVACYPLHSSSSSSSFNEVLSHLLG